MSTNTIEILRYGGYVFAAFAVLLFILAIVLFFTLKIKDVFYELSGKGRVKMTEKMTAGYEVTGTLRSSEINSGQLEKSGKTGGSGDLGTSRKTGNIQQTGQITHARKVSRNKPKSSGLAPGFNIEKEVVVVHTNERIQ